MMMRLPASKRHVSPEVAAWLDDLHARIERATGSMTRKEWLVSKAAPALLAAEAVKLRLGIDQQPISSRRTYRTPPATKLEEWARTLRRLAPGAPSPGAPLT